MAKKRKIVLLGELGRKFGRVHYFVINTPAEAIRALCANFKDFQKELCESHQRNVGYKVVVDDELLSELPSVQNPFSREIKIAPVIMGGKSKFLGIVLGIGLIAASFYLPGTSLLGSGGLFGTGAFATTSISSIAFGVGTSLLLGGISQMLSPQPKSDVSERPENQPSYSFNGAVNTTAQGQPVPVGYGRMIVGSAVISAGITADDYVAAGVE